MRLAPMIAGYVLSCACSDSAHPALSGGLSGAPGSGGLAATAGGAAPSGGVPAMTTSGPTTSSGGATASGGVTTTGVVNTGGAPGAGGIPAGGGSAAGGAGAIGGAGAVSGGTAGTNAGGAGGNTSEHPELAVTADFLNKTLSVVDVGKLTDGAKRENALVGTVDLSKYAPGPLDLAITPDGKTALVAVSGGWLSAFTTVPPGNGTLLFVDIATRTVTGELYTGASPMGIAITKDGKRAFVGQYGETYFAVVDIAKRTFDKVQTGAQFNEEVAIDDSGSVAILSYGPAGDCVTFSVDDPAGQRGATVGLTGDAGGTAFFPGTKVAYVVQAPTTLTGNVGGHNVVDVTNPKAPVASDNVRVPASPTWYRVAAVPPRKSVVFPSTQNGQLSIVEMKLTGNMAEQVQSVPVGAASTLVYGVNADANGRVLVANAQEHWVALVDLTTKKSAIIPWNVTSSGPTDIAVVP